MEFIYAKLFYNFTPRVREHLHASRIPFRLELIIPVQPMNKINIYAMISFILDETI